MKGKLKFWNPGSGALGGAVFALVIILVIFFLMAPVLHYLSIWYDYWK